VWSHAPVSLASCGGLGLYCVSPHCVCLSVYSGGGIFNVWCVFLVYGRVGGVVFCLGKIVVCTELCLILLSLWRVCVAVGAVSACGSSADSAMVSQCSASEEQSQPPHCPPTCKSAAVSPLTSQL
jgi:hypothetical protein